MLSFSEVTKNFEVNFEQTIGDGNCAFNAFTLALCREEVLNQIETNLVQEGRKPDEVFKTFIADSAKALGCDEKWGVVKETLIRLRKENKAEYLQEKLSPVMRNLACDLTERDTNYPSDTLQPFLSAFDEYIHKIRFHQASNTGVEDDIFVRHKFITDKFSDEFYFYDFQAALIDKGFNIERLKALSKQKSKNEVETAEFKALTEHFAKIQEQAECVIKTFQTLLKQKEKSVEEQQLVDKVENTLTLVKNQQLTEWWRQEGARLFATEMRKNRVWAGDLELKQLAKYFGVNLYALTGAESPVEFYNTGSFKVPNGVIDENICLELASRGIIQADWKTTGEARFLRIDNEEIKARLCDVKEFEDAMTNLTGENTIQSTWAGNNSACIQQLTVRNIIGKDCKILINDKEQLKKRAAKISDNEEELAKISEFLIHQHKKAPTLTLANLNAVHWSNTVSRITEKEKLIPVENTQENKVNPADTHSTPKPITEQKEDAKSSVEETPADTATNAKQPKPVWHYADYELSIRDINGLKQEYKFDAEKWKQCKEKGAKDPDVTKTKINYTFTLFYDTYKSVYGKDYEENNAIVKNGTLEVTKESQEEMDKQLAYLLTQQEFKNVFKK